MTHQKGGVGRWASIGNGFLAVAARDGRGLIWFWLSG